MKINFRLYENKACCKPLPVKHCRLNTAKKKYGGRENTAEPMSNAVVSEA
jgi:hypothetical protein